MKRWQKAVLNAIVVALITFFSTLSSEMAITGGITLQSLLAGCLGFSLTFLTLIGRLTDDDDDTLPVENDDHCDDEHNCPSIDNTPKMKSNSKPKRVQLWF